MRCVLRAIAGLPARTTFVIRERLTLGRAADTDVQLVDPEVSRRHARIEVDAQGRATLVDLASKAGTFVDGVRVDRTVLVSGATIAIGGFRLVFEHSRDDVVERRPPRRHGIDVLRVTMCPSPPPRQGVPQPLERDTTVEIFMPERVTAEPMAMPPRVTPAVAQQTAPATPHEGTTLRGIPIPTPIVGDDTTSRLGQTRRAPALDLVREVYDYRRLRLAELRGEAAGARQISVLEQQLQQRFAGSDPRAGLRRYRRFDCGLQAWLGRRDGRRVSTVGIGVHDISAGGARLTWHGPDGPAPGEHCWLVIDLEGDDDESVVVFRGRVVWTSPAQRCGGLVFSGAGQLGLDALELIRADLGR